MCGEFMKRPLIIALLAVSMVPLYAHARQPDMVKLKADAQKVVSIIGGDKAKSQTYCQMTISTGRSARLMRSKTARKLTHCPGK
jgi:hypothetical protein